ncbi:trypsin-like cysteine/serine peptidase domain-containing protein [Chlamydoabsidia padenii]|nr:trypsin-like cysteine/serine peptidase domain-containing protein [Chlamydoabsidia padenii]
MIPVFFFFTLVFCSLVGKSHGIANGTISQHPHPYFVTLLQPRLCGGVLISLAPEAWILTAAHCVSSTNPVSGVVHYGRHRQQSFHHVIVHPKYPQQKTHNKTIASLDDDDQQTIHATIYDLALIRLDHPIILSSSSTFSDDDKNEEDSYSSIYYHAMDPVQWNNNQKNKRIRAEIEAIPISMNTSAPLEFMGMGATSPSIGSESNRLITTSCHWTKDIRAMGIFAPYTEAVCIISTTSTLCHGDSGGPLVSRDQHEPHLDGILSRIMYAYDSNPDQPTCPTAEMDDLQMTNVFVKPAFHLPWISQITNLDPHTLTTSPSSTNAFSSSSSSYFDILHSASPIVVPGVWWVVVVLLGCFILGH